MPNRSRARCHSCLLLTLKRLPRFTFAIVLGLLSTLNTISGHICGLRVLDLLDWELQVVVTGALGTKLRSLEEQPVRLVTASSHLPSS